MKYKNSILFGLKIISLFAFAFSLSACQEKNFQKSLVGIWDVKTMTEDSVNLLNYYSFDTLFSGTCTTQANLHLITAWTIEFKKKNNLEIIEKRTHAYIDSLESITNCSSVVKVKDTTIIYKGTWETAGVGNLALIYNNNVDNIRITERTENDMVWEKDLNVSGGLVSFTGVRNYTVKRR
jgi:hypothetical protein